MAYKLPHEKEKRRQIKKLTRKMLRKQRREPTRSFQISEKDMLKEPKVDTTGTEEPFIEKVKVIDEALEETNREEQGYLSRIKTLAVQIGIAVILTGALVALFSLI